MNMNDVLNWLENDFGYSIPEEYMEFLKTGDFESTWRYYYVVDKENKNVLEISEWFTYDLLASVYDNCIEEELIEKYHLPIFDSCGMIVVIDCNTDSSTYGKLFVRSEDCYYDINLEKNIYDDFEFVSTSFSKLINNLNTENEIDDMNIW